MKSCPEPISNRFSALLAVVFPTDGVHGRSTDGVHGRPNLSKIADPATASRGRISKGSL